MKSSGGSRFRVATVGVAFSLLLLSSLIAFASSAHAHPDIRVVEEEGLLVPAGEFVNYSLSVHYHRVVGRFEVATPTDGRVTLRVMDEPSFLGYAAGQPATALYASRTARGETLNFLIACCVDAEWTTYHLVIENGDPTASQTVRVRVTLVHDDAAVTIHDGEPGAALLGTGFFVAVGAAIALDLYRNGREVAVPRATGRTLRGRIALYSLTSLAIFAAVIALGLGVMVVGLRAYGGDPVGGLVGGVAEIPLPPGPFGSALSVLAALLVLPWILALVLWGRAFSLTARTGSTFVGGLGLGEGLVTLLVGILFASAYGSPLVPMLVVGVFAVPQAAAGGLLLSRERMRRPPPPPPLEKRDSGERDY